MSIHVAKIRIYCLYLLTPGIPLKHPAEPINAIDVASVRIDISLPNQPGIR